MQSWRATPFNIEEAEKNHPLSSSQISLINSFFKPCYTRPVYIWALLGKDSKRKKLFDLLTLANPNKESARSKMVDAQAYRPDFVIKSAGMTLDLNKIFNKDTNKPKDERHYASSIRDQGVFGFPEEKTRPKSSHPSAEQQHKSLGELYAKKLFTEQALHKILPCAEANIDILKVLVDYVDQPSNSYLVNPLRNTSLDPSREKEIVRGTLKEDHVIEPMYKSKSKLPPPISSRGKDDTTNFRGAHSNYSENFTHDIFQKSKKTHIIDPIRNISPFSEFPPVEVKKEAIDREQYTSQSRQNKAMGKKNKDVFRSKTVL